MSSLFYPVGLISQVRVTNANRVLIDEFEAGNTSARRLWTSKTFKRQFGVTHAPLTAAEYEQLRGFARQHDGGYDSFWFRDNVTRGGNAKVRFASPLAPSKSRMIYDLAVELHETAAVESLPDWDEVATAAGVAPVAWYDAGRQRYTEHLGTAYYDPTIYDHTKDKSFPLVLQAGTHPLANTAAQYQHHRANGTVWAKSATNPVIAGGDQPALTWFLICRHSATTTLQAIACVGTESASARLAFGVGLAGTTGNYEAFDGVIALGSPATFANSPADTWRSVAVGVAGGSNSWELWVNGASIGSATSTRQLVAGPVSLFQNSGATATKIANPSNSMTNADVAHAILFNAKLTLAQIKAVHNLLRTCQGLAAV